MPRKTTRAHKRAQTEEVVHRPTALTLVMKILAALVNDGMAWLTIPVLAVTAFLYTNHFHNDIMLAFIIGGLIIIALVRGSRNWQRDLNEYQRHVAMERHREQVQEQAYNSFPGHFTSRPCR
jgi:hypothetical protein